MSTPTERKKLFIAGVYTDAVAGANPIKFKSYLLPEYFYCSIYLFDSDGKQVTKTNAKNFKAWSIKLLVRVSVPDTLETIETTISGARSYKGHAVIGFGLDEIKELGKQDKIKTSYYKSVADYRPYLMAQAITSAVQTLVYKKGKSGSHNWSLFSRRDISEEELQLLATGAIDSSYITLDDAFYKKVASVYRQAKANGEFPNEVLKQVFHRDSTKTVQGWTRKAYERGYLTDKDKGVSTVKKTVRKKATERKGK